MLTKLYLDTEEDVIFHYSGKLDLQKKYTFLNLIFEIRGYNLSFKPIKYAKITAIGNYFDWLEFRKKH